MLKDEVEVCVEDAERLKDMVVCYYADLSKSGARGGESSFLMLSLILEQR